VRAHPRAVVGDREQDRSGLALLAGVVLTDAMATVSQLVSALFDLFAQAFGLQGLQ
jgi:hypothetical protein